MFDQDRQDKLMKRVDRANLGLKLTLGGAVMVMFMTLGLLVFQSFQLKAQIEQTLRTAEQSTVNNHRKTQEYVRCIAQALVKQIEDRTEEDFDRCGIKVNIEPSIEVDLPLQPIPPTVHTPVAIEEEPPITNEPVKEPEEVQPKPDERKFLGIPLVDRLFYGLVDGLGIQ